MHIPCATANGLNSKDSLTHLQTTTLQHSPITQFKTKPRLLCLYQQTVNEHLKADFGISYVLSNPLLHKTSPYPVTQHYRRLSTLPLCIYHVSIAFNHLPNSLTFRNKQMSCFVFFILIHNYYQHNASLT